MNEVINYEDKKMLETLRNTVAKGTNDHEFALFIQVCRASQLNPFLRQIWCFVNVKLDKQGREVRDLTIFAGVMGILEVANSYSEYDGCEVKTLLDEAGFPVESRCKVWRKDRRLPTVGVARWKEDARRYRDGNLYPIWAEKSIYMLEKVAKARGHRETFPQRLANVYEPAELDGGDLVEEVIASPSVAPIVVKEIEPTFYRIEAPTKEQTLFMSKRGEYVQELGAWCVKKELEPREIEKLAPYKTTLEEIEATKAQAAAVAAQVEPVGEPQKVEREETPLEKAKKRVSKMMEGTPHEVI